MPSYIWLKFAAEALEIITNKPWNEMWNFTENDENVCRCKICSYDLNYLWTSFLGTLVKWPGKRKSNGSIYKRSVDTYLCKWRFHSTSPVNNIPVHSLYQWATRPKNVVVPPKNFFFLASIDWECMSKFSESQYKNPIISGVWSVRYVTHLLIKG